MGSYVFKWESPASEVFVTGTFDDWAKSVKLDKKGEGFEKSINIPSTSDKIYYKFVVDGNWTTNRNAPQETDECNNINNVLEPEDLEKPQAMSEGVTGTTISGVTPDSTTAQLASKVPKESDGNKNQQQSSDVPGNFPETPYHDAQEFTAKPIPASFGVGNPISLKPGERVPDPSEFSTNDTTTADTLDKESYENSGEGPSALAGAANPTIQSAGAGTTTAALAAEVSKEPRKEVEVIPGGESKDSAMSPKVPDVVQESITESHVAPEAAVNTEAVEEKAAMENELLKDVKPTDAKGEPAPTASAALTERAPASETKLARTGSEVGVVTIRNAPATSPALNATTTKDVAEEKEPDSGDISPLSHPTGQAQPTVTTGPAATSAPSKSEATPASPANKASAAASAEKKAKRGSFFAKLKDKLKHKDEK